MVMKHAVEFTELLGQLHGIRIPGNHTPSFQAEIAEQSGAGGAEAEDGVFDDRLASAD